MNTDTEDTNNALDVRRDDDLSLSGITGFREAKEDRWNTQGIKIDLKSAVDAHLSGVGNPHTKIAKQTDLTQFIEYLTPRGYLTIGDLGRLITPELNLLCGAFLDGLNLSKASLQRKMASIKVWFDFLHLNFPKLITIVPKLDSDRYKLTRTKGTTKALELEEWFRLKQALGKSKKNPRLLALCQTALLLGGRRIGELLSLKWSDIDFEKEIVAIRPSKKGTDASQYQLPLTSQLKRVLKDYKDSVKPAPDDLVFPVSPQSIDQSLKRHSEKAGTGKISFHTLRATFITWANERGDTQSEIMNATLHNSTQMIRYYDRTSKLKTTSINKMGAV